MRPKLFSRKQYIPPPIDVGLVSSKTIKKKAGNESSKQRWIPLIKKAKEDDNVVDALRNQLLKFGKDVFADTSKSISETNSLVTLQSSKASSLLTLPSPCTAEGFPETMAESEDDSQKIFIRNVLTENVYLHPSFVMGYTPLYCINRGNYGFTCIYAQRHNIEEQFTVKFVKKKSIGPSGWLIEDGRPLPLELVKYRNGYYKDLPVYRWHYEDSEYYYLITELRAHEKAEWEKTFLERVSHGLFGSNFHDINWEKHFQ